MQKQILNFALFLTAFQLRAQSEIQIPSINDSTVARYRYEEKVHQYALIPSGTSINQIDLSERDRLKPLDFHRLTCLGINQNSEPYYQTQNLSSTTLENWMQLAYLQILAPSGNYGFDSIGNRKYHFPHTEAEMLNFQFEANEIAQNGFQPILLFWPNKRDPFVAEAQNQGAILSNLPEEAFKLSDGSQETIIEPASKIIRTRYTLDSTEYEITKQYTLYAPYGYVPLWEERKEHRLDLAYPVTFVQKSTYYNHVIEDLENRIEKYTDKAYLEVYPNPVEGEFEIVMRGIPDAQVSQIQVRDHLGNIIQTYLNPTVNQDILHLDGSNYPNGVLILIVQTQLGLFAETFTKI